MHITEEHFNEHKHQHGMVKLNKLEMVINGYNLVNDQLLSESFTSIRFESPKRLTNNKRNINKPIGTQRLWKRTVNRKI